MLNVKEEDNVNINEINAEAVALILWPPDGKS